MNVKPHRHRKRLYLVNRDFQLRYAAAAILVGILSTVLTSTLILIPLYQFEILRIPRFLPWPVLLMMISAALVNIALVGLMTVHVTHRLAGPMFSLVRYLRRIEEGYWHGSLKLRDGDDLKYVARNFNEMLSSLRHRTQADLAIIREAQEGLRQESPAISEVLQALDRAELSLKERLGEVNQP